MSFLKSLPVWLCIVTAAAEAQRDADGPVLGAKAAIATTSFKIYNTTGRVRIVAWDRDSIVVRGHVARNGHFFIGGGLQGMKLGVEDDSSKGSVGRSDFTAYVPKGSNVSVKTVTADIEGVGASGWFYSVSGAIRLSGTTKSVEAESMNGNLDIDVVSPWIRARTGDGHLLIRGAPQDVDAATIAGTMDITAQSVLRGQFTSVSGDIHYVGTPAPGGIFEFSNHSGAVDMQMARDVAGTFVLSSIVGAIENGYSGVRPAASTPHSMRLTLGRGGANVTVRTYKGPIRLRPN